MPLSCMVWHIPAIKRDEQYMPRNIGGEKMSPVAVFAGADSIG